MALKFKPSVTYLIRLASFLSLRKKADTINKAEAKRKALLEKWISENGGIRKGAIKNHRNLISQHNHDDWTY